MSNDEAMIFGLIVMISFTIAIVYLIGKHDD
jgi:hypothetical protein